MSIGQLRDLHIAIEFSQASKAAKKSCLDTLPISWRWTWERNIIDCVRKCGMLSSTSSTSSFKGAESTKRTSTACLVSLHHTVDSLNRFDPRSSTQDKGFPVPFKSCLCPLSHDSEVVAKSLWDRLRADSDTIVSVLSIEFPSHCAMKLLSCALQAERLTFHSRPILILLSVY